LKNDNDPVLNDLNSHDLIRAGLLSPAENKAKRCIRLAIIGMYSPFNPSLTTKDVSIDNYQGEESDIVIASQTRFNDTNEIGFMNFLSVSMCSFPVLETDSP